MQNFYGGDPSISKFHNPIRYSSAFRAVRRHNHCYAKLVSTTHPIDGSTSFNP